jgi:hypothetical protein
VVAEVCAEQCAGNPRVEDAVQGQGSYHTEACQRHHDLTGRVTEEEHLGLGSPTVPHQRPYREHYDGRSGECCSGKPHLAARHRSNSSQQYGWVRGFPQRHGGIDPTAATRGLADALPPLPTVARRSMRIRHT